MPDSQELMEESAAAPTPGAGGLSGSGGRRFGGPPVRDSRGWWRIVRFVIPLLVLGFALLVPQLTEERFRLQVLTIVFINASLAAGLVISLGYAGMLNLSQGTFYGLGAYTTAILVTEHEFPLELAIPLAAIAGAAGAVLLGLTSLRVRGDYFALVSLAFTIAAVKVMDNWTSVTRGREGFFGIPLQSLFGVEINSSATGYYACLFLLTVTIVVVALFTRTFAARAMLAVRYDEVAARMMGINVAFTKLLAMAMSGGLAGMVGSFLVATVLFVKPSDFNLVASFEVMLWVIIGGMARLLGAVFTAAGLTQITEEFRQLFEYRVGLVGIVVLVAVFFRGGVLGDWIATARGRRRDRQEGLDSAPMHEH